MYISQRQVATALQTLMIIGLAAILTNNLIVGSQPISNLVFLVSLLVAIGLLVVHLRKWQQSEIAILAMAVVVCGITPTAFTLDRNNVLAMLIPAIFALIFGNAAWVLGGSLAALAIFLTRCAIVAVQTGANFVEQVNLTLPPVVLLLMAIGGMTLARLVTDNAVADARANAGRVVDSLAQAEQRSNELAELTRAQDAQITRQQTLLELVDTLETPTVEIAEGVLFAPIVGNLDDQRSGRLTERLLAAAHRRRTRLVILDISGVAMINMAVARALLNTAQALRLLGCEVVISGISATVALTLTQLDSDLHGITTVRSPQEAIKRYVRLGV